MITTHTLSSNNLPKYQSQIVNSYLQVRSLKSARFLKLTVKFEVLKLPLSDRCVAVGCDNSGGPETDKKLTHPDGKFWVQHLA